MHLLLIVLISIGWGICSVFGAAITLHHFTQRYPQFNNIGITIFVAVFGPLGLIVALILGHPLGLRFKSMNKAERRKEFERQFPYLSSIGYKGWD